ncbi:carboxypeptidase-like regulatory domain-containing protein [Deinococcus sp. DB0503]|uniref:carboxypeptidase-like regulatory domain-containing protein n=1 Tax=Deinococcus sp. DB0503 TaxID=2479203 RepID=UPI0018DFF0E7|nr:carboxypeptidase-like regulatory domain-containing protein [Deinococcus sp. DB0503]MBI0444876.1 carboxypeptidase regulatory-like domain-containing protein [Deinococcus sp. DB0503]
MNPSLTAGRAVPLFTALLVSMALAAGPRSALVEATFIEGAEIVNGSSSLGDFPAALREVATRAGGTCVKSEYVVWDSVDQLEDNFKQVLGSLGYSYTLLGHDEEGGHYAFFLLNKGNAALAGIWADAEGTTLLGWCSLKLTSASAPAALTPTAPNKVTAPPTASVPPPRTQAAPAPATPPPTVKPPTPKRGFISGLVLDPQGRPLAGAEISIVGTTFTQGQRTSFTVQTKADGTYSVRVPDGRYHATATIVRELAGVSFRLPLHPESGSLNTEVDSSEGGNLNFRWRLTGKKPGGGNGYSDFYGASVLLSYCGLPASAYCDARYSAITPGAAPEGSTVTLTFTPQGRLIDGTPGKPVVYSFKVAPLSPPGGYPYTNPNGGGRTTLGLGWPYHSQDFNDLPLGIYTLSATAALPDGRRIPLRLGLEENDVEYTSVPVKFASYDTSGYLKQLRIYLRD